MLKIANIFAPHVNYALDPHVRMEYTPGVLSHLSLAIPSQKIRHLLTGDDNCVGMSVAA